MSQRNKNIEPGWKMTTAQIYASKDAKQPGYFAMFAQVAAAKGWKGNVEQMKAYRREFHVMSGLGPCSAKTIDRMKGFDALKRTWLAIVQPSNLNAQMKMEGMPKHRLITRIKSMAHEDYWRALLNSPRFKARELENLDEKGLIDFRNTLEARLAASRDEHQAPPARRVFYMPDAAPVEQEERELDPANAPW